MPPRPSRRWISERPICDPGSNIADSLPGGRKVGIFGADDLGADLEAHTISLRPPERHYLHKFFRCDLRGGDGSASNPRISPATSMRAPISRGAPDQLEITTGEAGVNRPCGQGCRG